MFFKKKKKSPFGDYPDTEYNRRVHDEQIKNPFTGELAYSMLSDEELADKKKLDDFYHEKEMAYLKDSIKYLESRPVDPILGRVYEEGDQMDEWERKMLQGINPIKAGSPHERRHSSKDLQKQYEERQRRGTDSGAPTMWDDMDYFMD